MKQTIIGTFFLITFIAMFGGIIYFEAFSPNAYARAVAHEDFKRAQYNESLERFVNGMIFKRDTAGTCWALSAAHISGRASDAVVFSFAIAPDHRCLQ